MNFKFLIFNFQKRYILLTLIILIAGFLRLNELGINPPALDWDEASLGYNAYSILKTGKDEFGRFLPISIRSFEDYKPAVYTYLAIPGVAAFGLNEFAVRLPSAILGTLTVLVVYFLVKELCRFGNLALLIALLLAISPWHLQFSRVAFEANVGLFFVSSGVLFFLKGLKKGSWLFVSMLSFVISFYSYHSPRLVVPLLLFGWVIYFRQELWQLKKWVLISSIVGLILLIPFFQEALTVGKARLGSVTSLNPNERLGESIKLIEDDKKHSDYFGVLMHNRRVVYGSAILQGYLDHFNLDFLFFHGDAPLRHHAPDMGMLYIWEAPFILVGMIQFVKKKFFLVWWWFLVAPLASAITTGTPHAVRSLLYLPIYQIFTAAGLLYVSRITYHLSQNVRRFFFVGFTIFVIVNIFYYLDMYYVHAPIEAAKEWQYGYKEAVAEMAKKEDAVDKIVVTYAYDQPHIFILFYEKIDPAWYQKQWSGGEVKRFGRTFGKYEFRNIDWGQDKALKDTLVIGTPGEIPEDVPGKIADIHFPDGQVAFRVVKL